MKLIQLTQGKFTQVDDEDYEYLNQWKWHYEKTGYAARNKKQIINGKSIFSTIRMHSVIINTPKGKVIDHKDRNGLNNCRENLRIATQRQNLCNRGPYQNNHLKGVQFLKGAWQAYTSINGKIIYIGRFPTEHLAALARDLWTVDLHSEFADTNFKIIHS